MLGLCLYGLLTRKKHFIRFGLSGIGGSIFGMGMTHMILVDPVTGFFAALFGLALVWFVNPGILMLLRRRRGRGYWIQINDQKLWIPSGVREVEIDVYLEFLKTANPARKVEKTMAPKKGENEENYRKRMR
jgi:hypothetical protein